MQRVLDDQVLRLAAQVLVHRHAVHHVEVFERHRASDREAAARSSGMHRRGHQHHGAVITLRRQRGHERLLEVGGDLAGLRQDVGRAANDLHRFGHAGDAHFDRQRKVLRRREADGSLDTLESGQLEHEAICARGQQREDVVAVFRGHRLARGLKVWRGRGHRHTGKGQALRIDHPT